MDDKVFSILQNVLKLPVIVDTMFVFRLISTTVHRAYWLSEEITLTPA